jgi:hypothetical protein
VLVPIRRIDTEGAAVRTLERAGFDDVFALRCGDEEATNGTSSASGRGPGSLARLGTRCAVDRAADVLDARRRVPYSSVAANELAAVAPGIASDDLDAARALVSAPSSARLVACRSSTPSTRRAGSSTNAVTPSPVRFVRSPTTAHPPAQLGDGRQRAQHESSSTLHRYTFEARHDDQVLGAVDEAQVAPAR